MNEVFTVTQEDLNELVRERVKEALALASLDTQALCVVLDHSASRLRGDENLSEDDCAEIASEIEEAVRRLEELS